MYITYSSTCVSLNTPSCTSLIIPTYMSLNATICVPLNTPACTSLNISSPNMYVRHLINQYMCVT